MTADPSDPRVERALQAPVTSSRTWRGRFGAMLIETRADGSVWIDGEVVIDTLPSADVGAAPLPASDDPISAS